MKLKKQVNFSQRCVDCSREYDVGKHVIRCVCGGLINFDYDYGTLTRWRPSKTLRGIARYAPCLPVMNKRNLIQPKGTRFPTPLHRTRHLGRFLGLRNLWIKDETKNPTKTFKIRDALVTLSRFQEIDINEFVLSSTGNTAAAFSWTMRFARVRMVAHIFFPEWAVIDLDRKSKGAVEGTVVNDDYNATIETARRYSEQSEIQLEGGFSNPCRIEASKTIAYEIEESGLKPDWYVQAVTSGSGVYGFYKGYSELRKMDVTDSTPRILCVQPEDCAPMANAFRASRDKIAPGDVVTDPDTFATTLMNGNPSFSYPYVRRVVLNTKGTFETVSEREIAHAFLLFMKLEGLIVDPAAAAALAGVAKAYSGGTIEENETVILNVSGGLRQGPPAMLNARQPNGTGQE